jgi:uncharacterized protein YfaS (alpha-2-macroglobulin family)
LAATGVTDEHGVCVIARDDYWESNLWPVMAVLEQGDDISILRFNGNIWQAGDENYAGRPYLRGEYQGICYTPRGVFRPGETVPVQMLIRASDLTPEKPFPVQLKIYSSTGREWSSTSVTLSEMGMGSSDIQLSDSAPSGTWRADVLIPGENIPIASGEFRVEDFAPPKIKVEVSGDTKELFFGDSPDLDIYAEYLFGAAGDGLSYEIESSLIPREYYHPDWQGYSFSDRRVAFSQRNGIETSGALSPEGKASVTLAPFEENAASMLDVSYRIGVREDGGRWVYKSINLPYYPRRSMLGIKYAGENLVTNTEIPFAFAAIDTNGKPLDPEGVTMTVYQRITRRIMTTSGKERRSELRSENIPVEQYDKKPVEFEKGYAESSLKFAHGGFYSVVLENPGGEMRASADFYVYDARWGWGYDDGDAALPETLTIKLDKEIYAPGERATATISGSFEGTALLSVETDSILHYDTASGKTPSFSFEVTEDMAPNAWVTAHMIRAAIPEDTWSAHRSFGAVPLKVDCSDRRLDVSIAAPDRIKPAEENKFTVQLKDKTGRGVRGEAAIILVDEGVLGLTRYQTPDFYKYYTAMRALTLRAYDIYTELMPIYLKPPAVLSPGGDGDDAMESTLKASMSPVRANRFRILTLVQRVMTDENGRADFTIDVPEFAGSARLMAVAASKGEFGSSEGVHTIARDVVTEVTLPRILAPDDVMESQLQLFNRTGKTIDISVELNISGPISITAAAGNQTGNDKTYSRKYTLEAGEKPTVTVLTLKADKESGVAGVRLRTKYGEESQEQATEIAVRPPYPRITKSGSITIDPGESREIELPSDWFPGTRRALLTMSGLPLVGISDAAKFLCEYPYGCLEQTVSAGWSMISLPDLIAKIDPKLASKEQLEYSISRVIMRIQSMQLYNGAFTSWPGSSVSSWTSVYTAHFLTEAEKRGWDVPAQTLSGSIDYLRYLISLPPDASEKYIYSGDLAVRAYAAYVLTLRGEAPLAWMSYLRDNISSMPQYGRMLLAAAYAASRDAGAASSLLGENLPPIAQSTAEKTLNYNSFLRTKAINLMAWNQIDPSSPSAVAAASELLSAFESTRWYTTQEAAWSMLTLADFFAAHRDEGDAILTLSRDGAEALTAAGDDSLSESLGEDVTRVTVKNSGTGNGYVRWTADGVPSEKPSPVDSGLEATVEYYDSRGFLITKDTPVESGSKIKGVVTLCPLSGEAQDIVVSLPLAGGLEIENPRLIDSGNEYENDPYVYGISRTEMRDDRLLLFVDSMGKKFKWEFTMRAVTPGSFILPPISAEGMYSPGTRSIGETSWITIR